MDKKGALETGSELLLRRSEKRGAERNLWSFSIRLRRSRELKEGVVECWFKWSTLLVVVIGELLLKGRDCCQEVTSWRKYVA